MVLDGISEPVKAVRERTVGVVDLVGKQGQSGAVPIFLVRFPRPGQEECFGGGRGIGRCSPTGAARRGSTVLDAGGGVWVTADGWTLVVGGGWWWVVGGG